MRPEEERSTKAGRSYKKTSRARRDAPKPTRAQIERAALRVAKLRGEAKHGAVLVLADMLDEANWPMNEPVPTGRGKRWSWTVWSLDVWGNQDDGFEINDRTHQGTLSLAKREYLHGVRWYRDWVTDPARTRALGAQARYNWRVKRKAEVTTRTDEPQVPEIHRALIKQGFLNRAARYEDVEYRLFAEGLREVSDRETGEPLFHLESKPVKRLL